MSGYKTLEEHSKDLQKQITENLIILSNRLNHLKQIDFSSYLKMKNKTSNFLKKIEDK